MSHKLPPGETTKSRVMGVRPPFKSYTPLDYAKGQDLAYSKRSLAHMVNADRKARASNQMKKGIRVRRSLEWNVHKLKQILHDKITSRVRRPEDTMRVAYRIFGVPKDGINRASFKRSLERMDLHLSEPELEEVFRYFDPDGSGVVTFNEFINALIPKNFTRKTWAELRSEDMNKHRHDYIMPDEPNFPKSMDKFRWKLEDIEAMIREKMIAHCRRPEDQFRAGFQLFGRPKHGISPHVMRKTLGKLGISITPDEAVQLMVKFDTDGSGRLDFDEFARELMPADYTVDPWSFTQSKKNQQELRAKQLRVGVDVVNKHEALVKQRAQMREDARVKSIHDRTQRFKDAQQRLIDHHDMSRAKQARDERRSKSGKKPKSALTSLYNSRAFSTIDNRRNSLGHLGSSHGRSRGQSRSSSSLERARSATGGRRAKLADTMSSDLFATHVGGDGAHTSNQRSLHRAQSAMGPRKPHGQHVGFDMTQTSPVHKIASLEQARPSPALHRARSAVGTRATAPTEAEAAAFGGTATPASSSKRPMSAAPVSPSRRNLSEALEFAQGSSTRLNSAAKYINRKLTRKRPKTAMMLSGLSLRTVRRDIRDQTRVAHGGGWK
jgi:Ca2+-binding EF-hand superfamily protein